MDKNVVRTREAMEMLSVSRATLERYERDGRLPVIRQGRTKYFKIEDIEALVGTKLRQNTRKRIAYTRVSSAGQKDDLLNQQKAVETFAVANGKKIDLWLSDVGSGLNFKRKNFLKLIELIENGEVSEVIVTYKDRLARFAFDLIEERCKANQTVLTVINLPSSSPQEELVTDLMTVIHVFSSRLYGLRKYKIRKEDLIDSTKDQDISDEETTDPS